MSSDDAEESIPIAASLTKGTKAKMAGKGVLSSPCYVFSAASLTKGTKAKKAAKGELSSPCCVSHAVYDALWLLA